MHRHPDGVLVEPQITLASISDLDQRAVDRSMFGYVPRPGDLVVDVGAGSGLETLPFSRRVASAGRVIAIEAHPLMFCCLEEVRRLNSLSNYQADTTITERDVPVARRALGSIVESIRIEWIGSVPA